MNYATASRHGSVFLPLRSGAKSPPTEGYASSRLPVKRAICAFPSRHPTPSTTIIATTTTAPFKPAARLPSAAAPVANKWFKEPKIPLRFNSSTLIRMRNKDTSEVIRDSRTNNQLAVTAMSFLKRDRRMSDHEVAKGASPFGDASFVKNVFLNIVSQSKAMAAVSAAANPRGDGAPTGTTYHRISAFSLNDRKSGCNLKFVERVSFEGAVAAAAVAAAPPPPPPATAAAALLAPSAVNSVGQFQSRLPVVGKTGNSSFNVHQLNAMLQKATLGEPRKLQNGGGGGGGDDGEVVKEGSDFRLRAAAAAAATTTTMATKKKKSSRKHKRAVVITSLKNSSVKFVRKTSSRDAGTQNVKSVLF